MFLNLEVRNKVKESRVAEDICAILMHLFSVNFINSIFFLCPGFLKKGWWEHRETQGSVGRIAAEAECEAAN
jgi:hypothetical protein